MRVLHSLHWPKIFITIILIIKIIKIIIWEINMKVGFYQSILLLHHYLQLQITHKLNIWLESAKGEVHFLYLQIIIIIINHLLSMQLPKRKNKIYLLINKIIQVVLKKTKKFHSEIKVKLWNKFLEMPKWFQIKCIFMKIW